MRIRYVEIDAIRQTKSLDFFEGGEVGAKPYRYRYEVDARVGFEGGARMRGTYNFEGKHGIHGFTSAEQAIRKLYGEAE